MHLKSRHLRQVSNLLPRILKGNHSQQCREAFILTSVFSLISEPYSHSYRICNSSILNRGFHSQSYFQVRNNASEASNESTHPLVDDILPFIQSAFNDLQGPNHCWLNRFEENRYCFKKVGTFLVLAGQFLENSRVVSMLEKVKTLQQRFPQLCIMGLHYGSSMTSAADQTYLVELIMKEYITFPILLSNKNFLEMEDGACYILLKDFSSPVFYLEKDMDVGMLSKAIEEIQVEQNGNLDNGKSNNHNLKSTWVKQAEAIKEPDLPSFLQNLLFYFPGCVSADEIGNRLFLSDINHHRIIICNGNGKIMDSIGSSPGFEDGEFESARLLHPAASLYDDAEDCLYIVDSENQAIRRADLERRVLETLYPTSSISKNNSSIWTWIMNKMGFSRNTSTKSEDFDSQTLVFPWHLMKSEDDNLLILNCSFDTLWIMDSASGEIKEVIREFTKIMETCGHLIMEKVSLLQQMPKDWLQVQIDANCSPNGLPFGSHISSATTFQDHIVVCDTVAQRLLRANRESGVCSIFQLSNFGILGFPYWASFPLEKVYSEGPPSRGQIDHVQCFSLLPGKVDIKLKIDIPLDIELVEPLQEGCIWRQARGAAATEVSGREGEGGSSEKVGVAQQWYDDLDNLAFSNPEPELTLEDGITTPVVESQDDRIHVDCAVNTSPGTSEVIIDAALYLKLRKHSDLQEGCQEKCAVRIVDIMNKGKVGIGRDWCIQLLLKSKADLRDLVFMKPLHVRIKINSLDYPKADNGKGTIETDTSIEVNVKLET